MDERTNKLSKQEIELLEEVDRIMEEVNCDPAVADVTVPPELRNKIFQRIRVLEAEKAKENLSDENEELIRLGKIYKRRRKYRKYYALAAAAVLAMAFGITSLGGPERVFEVAKRFIAGREQVQINSQDEDIKTIPIVDEAEAYQKIEDEFGFYPVSMNYLPEGIHFQEATVGEEIQGANLIYNQGKAVGVAYFIRPNYRTSSLGTDVEDKLADEYKMQVSGVEIAVKEYFVEAENKNRWVVEFLYKDVQYFIRITDCSKEEVKKIVENLYFY